MFICSICAKEKDDIFRRFHNLSEICESCLKQKIKEAEDKIRDSNLTILRKYDFKSRFIEGVKKCICGSNIKIIQEEAYEEYEQELLGGDTEYVEGCEGFVSFVCENCHITMKTRYKNIDYELEKAIQNWNKSLHSQN